MYEDKGRAIFKKKYLKQLPFLLTHFSKKLKKRKCLASGDVNTSEILLSLKRTSKTSRLYEKFKELFSY